MSKNSNSSGKSKSSNNNIIRMVEDELPAGFRFHPRDDELVCDYLMKKVTHTHTNNQSILFIQVDLNNCEPWDIPESACVGGKEWYFYSQRDRKYRTNRATISGYWKATGKDRAIHRKGSLVGMRKTLVFYKGRAPKGQKTHWVMHEFRLQPPTFSSLTLKEDWVLCRVFNKSEEVCNQQSMGRSYTNAYDDDTAGSSFFLPPLMDSYNITSEDHHPTQLPNNIHDNNGYNELVPCFSNFPSANPQLQDQQFITNNNNNNHNPIFTQFNYHQFEPNNIIYNNSTFTFGKNNIQVAASDYCLDPAPFACEKKVIKAVLNQLTKMEEGDIVPNYYMLQDGSSPSSESYLSDQVKQMGMPTNIMWNHHH